MRTDFQSDLDSLEAGFQEMGEVVSRAIRGAVDALRTQDVELCDEVIAFDDEIDDRYLGMENQIHLVLARQTPVATDLRLVLALLHSAIHAERMGDQCVTIAIVTHNMQQAARVADLTAFFSVEVRDDGKGRNGILVEYDLTTKIFTNPSDKRTEDYVTGRFG